SSRYYPRRLSLWRRAAIRANRRSEGTTPSGQASLAVGRSAQMRVRVRRPRMLTNLLGGLGFLVVVGALLFGSAGRWDLPMFWAYLGVWFAGITVGGTLIDPSLTKERLRPGPGALFFWSDWLIPPLWLGQYVVAGLDVGR